MSQINTGLQNIMNLGGGKSQDLAPLNSKSKTDINKSSADNVDKVQSRSSKFSDIVKDKNVDSDRVSKNPDKSDVKTGEDKTIEQSRLQSKSQDIATEEARPKAVTRQQAMSLFLQQMEEQLGIEPEEIVEAFAELDAATLMSSPEESAEKVIASLDLNSVDEKKAKGLYQDMLAMSAAAGMGGYLNQTGQTAKINVLSEKEAANLKMQQSLDRMNNQFFMRGAFSAQKANPAGMSAYERMNSMHGMQDAVGMNAAPSAGPLGAGDLAERAMFNNMNQPIQEAANPKLNTGETELQPEGFAALTAIPESTGPAPVVNADASTMTGLEVHDANANSELLNLMESTDGSELSELLNKNTIDANADFSSGIETSELQSGVVPVQYGAGQQTEDNFDDENGESHDDLMNQRVQDLGQNQKTVSGKAVFQMPAAAPTETDVKENVKEIISQAQFLAKKGGGEMKVALSPEGIGDLSLKVKMADGQVNVEMVTSSDEAKKMLEKGLSELKESLASHKLHLDSVKIENTKDISSQLNDQKQDLERSFQQKFMNDFRERNNSFRNEFFEVGSPRIAKSQTQDEASNAGYNYGKKRRTDGSARRLDLVA